MKALIGAAIGLFIGFIFTYIDLGGGTRSISMSSYLFVGVPIAIVGGIIGLGFEIASKKKEK